MTWWRLGAKRPRYSQWTDTSEKNFHHEGIQRKQLCYFFSSSKFGSLNFVDSIVYKNRLSQISHSFLISADSLLRLKCVDGVCGREFQQEAASQPAAGREKSWELSWMRAIAVDSTWRFWINWRTFRTRFTAKPKFSSRTLPVFFSCRHSSKTASACGFNGTNSAPTWYSSTDPSIDRSIDRLIFFTLWRLVSWRLRVIYLLNLLLLFFLHRTPRGTLDIFLALFLSSSTSSVSSCPVWWFYSGNASPSHAECSVESF